MQSLPRIDSKVSKSEMKFNEWISEAFKDAQQNGVLTKDKFNEALICIEFFNAKRLRDTPLGHRLFKLLAVSDGKAITEQEWINGLKNFMRNEGESVKFTFKCFD